MTLLSRLFYLFPAVHVTAIGVAAAGALSAPGLGSAATLLAVIYLLPVALFRVHDAIWPLREGRTPLTSGGYNPWWGASQLQWTFVAFPFLETALRAYPGLFSLWLRAWKAHVGRGVLWTPELVVLDRPMLDIGDRAVIGYQVGFSGHLVSTSEGSLELVVARNRVGRGALIGAGAKVFPGAVIGDKALVGVDTRVGSFARLGDRARTGGFCHLDHNAEVADDAQIPSFTQIRRAEREPT